MPESKPVPMNKKLYEQAKKVVYKQYDRPSAFRSAAVVKLYKKMGGKYSGKRSQKKGLTRWFAEKWKDVNPEKSATSYPVYRPTVRVTKKTPKTVKEISRKRLLEQSRRKQRLRSRHLEPF